MSELELIYFLVPVIWVALVALASVIHRKNKGVSFPDVHAIGHAFAEYGASGASLKNAFTRIGGAKNCLNVVVSTNCLYVFPMFPFNLLFLPEVFDLEHKIPLKKINRVQQHKGVLVRSFEVCFDSQQKSRVIKLRLRKPDEFIDVLKAHGLRPDDYDL